ncbi:hypothetical protein AB0M46_27920 [Dactylosporangium sp. NPDC051485]|uniref:hypothetical protein n=1 Tax=Dactylosporangium sp. NPDC051485 TaxID=3154846 RepID=UPI003423998F
MIGVRGIHEAIVSAFGAAPANLSSRLVAQANAALTAERDERGREPDQAQNRRYLMSQELL